MKRTIIFAALLTILAYSNKYAISNGNEYARPLATWGAASYIMTGTRCTACSPRRRA